MAILILRRGAVLLPCRRSSQPRTTPPCFRQAFVYSVCVVPGTSRFASCGEDSCLKIWEADKSAPIQNIDLPCVSVWNTSARFVNGGCGCHRQHLLINNAFFLFSSLSPSANGDIIVGCDDGTARIFTHASSRVVSFASAASFS